MKSERALCRADNTGKVLKFVCDGLKDSTDAYVPCLAIGIYHDDTLIGGVLINDIRPQRDCWLTIYTSSPKWATKGVMRYVFNVVFGLIGCQRCSVFVSQSNKKSLDMCLRLGFKKEGMLRKYRDNGENCYVLGMLKQECFWIKDNKK